MTSSSLRKVATSRKKYFISSRDKLTYDTEYALLRVIEQEIDLSRSLEGHREDL